LILFIVGICLRLIGDYLLFHSLDLATAIRLKPVTRQVHLLNLTCAPTAVAAHCKPFTKQLRLKNEP
jgi:hypothetical protein